MFRNVIEMEDSCELLLEVEGSETYRRWPLSCLQRGRPLESFEWQPHAPRRPERLPSAWQDQKDLDSMSVRN